MAPRAPSIMVIRHAEKPGGLFAGVTERGETNAHALSVRGWQRAGALCCLFAPSYGPLQNALLTKPAFIFASASVDDPTSGNSRSRRSLETLSPLAQRIGIQVSLTFSKGEEKALAEAAQACPGPVLIAWQHENISAIAHAIVGAKIAPLTWPPDRFDVIFVFTLDAPAGTYRFAQVPQCLLDGDAPNPF
jgi:hypothetical protein